MSDYFGRPIVNETSGSSNAISTQQLGVALASYVKKDGSILMSGN